MRDALTAVLAMIAIAGSVLALVACNRPDTVRTVFTVEGMHCESCSSAITTALEKSDGVIEASADYEKGKAEAVYHARKVAVETLKAEIEDLGYTVTGMSTEAVES